ncbi:MAG: aminotransferase class I/II-fold pyridoxal phosphate-dependent enzyme [Clostridiales bacterium]|nr:aminotransferase class I/II-fold pyridoxal phosphate-dependent enzyme [Clostridiales bacterium]
MRNFVNKKVAEMKPSGIRKFFDILQTMEGAISLGVGEPDFITPQNICDAAIRSIREGYTQYTGNRGLPELRENISRYLSERLGVEYPPEQTLITVGASEAIDLAIRAVCEEGDEILVPQPSFVSYSPTVTLAGGVPVPLICTEENGFIVTPEEIERAVTKKTKGIILSYPNNPTGAIMTKEQLEKIAPVIEKYDLIVISDEIYAELTYTGKHFSIAGLPKMSERTVYIGGFSKAFAMTGWRVGFVCAPKEVDEAMFKIHQYSIMCAPQPSQHAAICALEEGFEDGFASVEGMRAEYYRRGRYLAESMNKMGLKCFMPQGAFYIFANVESTGMDGEEFANALLNEHKVAVVPGSAFGEAGKYFVRCSYATSMENIEKAVAKIEKFINK